MSEVKIKVTSSHQCSVCGIECSLEALYRCETCTDEADLECPVKFFCDACVTSGHVRKQHKIRDGSYREVVVCSDHRNLCHMFCQTCKTLLCSICIHNHETHEFITIKAKAKKCKSDVFELLDDLEKKEKLANAKSKDFSEKNTGYQSQGAELISALEKEIAIMKNRLVELITAKVSSVECVSNRAKENLREMIELQGSLRSLLSFSDSMLSQQFIVLEETSKNAVDSFRQLDVCSIDGEEFCKPDQLSSVITESSNQILWDLNIPQGVKISERQVFFVDLGGVEMLYKITRNYQELKVEKLTVDEQDLTVVATDMTAFKLSEAARVNKVYPFANEEIFIELEDKKWITYEPNSKCFESMPDHGLEQALYPVKVEDQVQWIHYNINREEVLYVNTAMIIRCREVPKTKMSSHISSTVALHCTESNTICVVNTNKKSAKCVAKELHKIDSIDSISVCSEETLFVWSVELESVVILKYDGTWFVEKNISWQNESSCFEIEFDQKKYRLTPFIYVPIEDGDYSGNEMLLPKGSLVLKKYVYLVDPK